MSRVPATPTRRGALVAAGALAAAASIGLPVTGLATSACTETLAQIDDAGPFVAYEGGHPPPSMYGAPCDLYVEQPERCCGEVAKAVPAALCYGCAGKVAFALCTGGAFTCACTCDAPRGYALLPPNAPTSECDAGGGDGPTGDAPLESGPPDALAEASPLDALTPDTATSDGPLGDGASAVEAGLIDAPPGG